MLDFIDGANMEQVTTSLLNLLGGALEAIANFFGVTVQYTQEHFVEYVIKFGMYRLVLGICTCFAICGALLLLIIVGTCLSASLYCAWVRGEGFGENREKNRVSFCVAVKKPRYRLRRFCLLGFLLYIACIKFHCIELLQRYIPSTKLLLFLLHLTLIVKQYTSGAYLYQNIELLNI